MRQLCNLIEGMKNVCVVQEDIMKNEAMCLVYDSYKSIRSRSRVTNDLQLQTQKGHGYSANCEWVFCEPRCERRRDWSAIFSTVRRLPATAILASAGISRTIKLHTLCNRI